MCHNREERRKEMMTLKEFVDTIKKEIDENIVKNISIEIDPDWGTVVYVTVDLPLKETMELWLKLAKKYPYKDTGIHLVLRSLGEKNITDIEMADYIVSILNVNGIRPKIDKPLNVVEELRKERDKR
jgi:hypothetical protein